MNFKNITINERVCYLRKNEFSMTMEDFGQRIEMTKGAVSYMEKGNRVVSERTIKIICHEFNVNETWLRTGEGEMFVRPETFSLDEYAKKKNLTQLELDIIKTYIDLDEDIREKILDHFKVMFNKQHIETKKAEKETSATIPSKTDSRLALEEEADNFAATARELFLKEKKQALKASSANESAVG